MNKHFIRGFVDEIEKIAGSVLRSRVRVVPFHYSASHPHGFRLMLGERQIGLAVLKPGKAQIQGIEIDPKYRAMGLGRKLYGEIARQMPDQSLASDFGTSPSAAAAWRKMQASPGRSVRERMLGEEGPQFKMTLPRESAKRGPAVASVGRTEGNTANELKALAPQRSADRDRFLYGILGRTT